jgi:FkbM family methyltransferase
MTKAIKDFIYSLIELLTLGKGISREINGFKIIFPPKWSRYFESDYEKENVVFIKSCCNKGMTVIDVGAHLGLISVIIGKIIGSSGRVYSFEPTPATFKELKRIVKLNGLTDIAECINEAVSEKEGELTFFISETEGSNSNSLVNRSDLNRESYSVKSVSIDKFSENRNLNKIDLIKIDAEGVELAVLKGAKNVLLKFRPKVILAIHPSLIVKNGDSLKQNDTIKELDFKIIHKSKELDEMAFCGKDDFFDVHLIPIT